MADERNGSGPDSSCLPLHLISRSYGENLPAVNIWFSLAWTILCVGSATVWICGGFPGCLSTQLPVSGVFLQGSGFCVPLRAWRKSLNAIQWTFFHIYNTQVKTKKKKITSEQLVILSSLPHSVPPCSWRCNPSATYSFCSIFRWLSWQSDFVEVSLSDYTPGRTKRWWCWNAAMRAVAFFPSILLTKFSGSQCSAPLSVPDPSYWFMADFAWEFAVLCVG